MILPTYTEDEILQELIEDFKSVKRKAKSIADSFYIKAKKSGRFIRETITEDHYITTNLNNKWYIVIEYNQRNRIPWVYRACCIAEGSKKSKDYYLLRGIKAEKPYYIKLTTHALKRTMERNNIQTDILNSLELYACWAFAPGETGIGVKYLGIEKMKLSLENDCSDENISDLSYMIMVMNGIYFAKRSEKGNYLFKTFVSPEMGWNEMELVHNDIKTPFKKEGEHLEQLLILHQYYNKGLYPSDVLQGMLYKYIDYDDELEQDDNCPYVVLN